jgi:hypothetical protein
MKDWLGEINIESKLLLRGTVDGFGKEACWNIIHNK